jgi:hypothetical protein
VLSLDTLLLGEPFSISGLVVNGTKNKWANRPDFGS